MMLFWAGLRGAVGVALAAGIKGHNAKSLRTTVLVSVVMTLVIFGGTTTKMIEIVGIRTGVEEDDDSSDDEGPGYRAGRPPETAHMHSRLVLIPACCVLAATGESPYRDHYRNESRLSLPGRSKPPYINTSRDRDYLHGSHDNFDSDEDDPEVLPSATSIAFSEGNGDASGDVGNGGSGGQAVWRDGQWFNVIDERYLLPVFSNATASRRQANRKALRSSARLGHFPDSSVDEGGPGREGSPGSPERDLSAPQGDAPRSPWSDSSAPHNAEQPPAGGATGNGSGRRKSVRSSFSAQARSHQHTPSLGAAVSSLLSSYVASSDPSSPAIDEEEGGAAGDVELYASRPMGVTRTSSTSRPSSTLASPRTTSPHPALHNPFLSSSTTSLPTSAHPSPTLSANSHRLQPAGRASQKLRQSNEDISADQPLTDLSRSILPSGTTTSATTSPNRHNFSASPSPSLTGAAMHGRISTRSSSISNGVSDNYHQQSSLAYQQQQQQLVNRRISAPVSQPTHQQGASQDQLARPAVSRSGTGSPMGDSARGGSHGQRGTSSSFTNGARGNGKGWQE